MPWETGIFLRVFDPGTHYRQESFIHQDAIYVAKEDCVFIVVRQDSKNQYGSHAELAWIYPEEVRLLATVALSINEDQGMIFFRTGERQALNIDSCTPLHVPALIDLAERNARRLLAQRFPDARFKLYSWPGHDEKFDYDLFDGINPADTLIIRGLYCLLKGARLMQGQDSTEEAVMNVQISREACLEIIRELLLAEGNVNPSFSDAHAYITENFRAGTHLADYFLHEHDLWIATKHPYSAFGPIWIPPLIADDFYDTYKGLVSVYRHLLTGEPGRAAVEIPEADVE